MTRTFLDAGVLIATARGIGIIPVRAHAILDDAERTFVTSEYPYNADFGHIFNQN